MHRSSPLASEELAHSREPPEANRRVASSGSSKLDVFDEVNVGLASENHIKMGPVRDFMSFFWKKNVKIMVQSFVKQESIFFNNRFPPSICL